MTSRGSLGFAVALVGLSVTAAPGVAAQDPPGEGVRVGITYTPGVRPGMLVLGG